MKNNKGIIHVNRNFIKDELPIVMLAFAHFVPVYIEDHPWDDKLIYYGYSPLFEDLSEGEQPPVYDAVFQINESITKFLHFKRL